MNFINPIKNRIILHETKLSEIIEWPDNKILKLYKHGFEDKAQREIKNNLNLGDQVFAPKYFDSVQYDGRIGLVFEKISGISLAQELYQKPYKLLNIAKQMAELHFQLHSHLSNNLGNLTINLEPDSCKSIIANRIKDQAIEILNRLPKKNNICHGDFYLKNIIRGKNGYFIVDWESALRADPTADVARTINNLSFRNTHWLQLKVRHIIRNAYLKYYSRLNPEVLKNLTAWQFILSVKNYCDKDQFTPTKRKSYQILIDELYNKTLKN